jgi:hypothetical protein
METVYSLTERNKVWLNGTVVKFVGKRTEHPGYLGGRDQEDCGSKPALGK